MTASKPSVTSSISSKWSSVFKKIMSSSERSSSTSAAYSNAWSVSSEAASEYLLARIPYPQYIIEYILTYHEHSKTAKWDAVLDLGCGPGQLAMLLSTRFKHIYGRDVSEEMISIAKTLPSMDKEALQQVGLPKPPTGRTFDYEVGQPCDLKMPDNSVDMIVIGSAAHWFDWSSEEAIKRIWNEWTRVLRKDGTIIVIGGIPTAGNWIGPDSQKTKPIRHLMRNFPFEGELAKYYNKIQADLGTGSCYNSLPMPWDHCPSDQMPSRGWIQSSRLFVMFDSPDDVSSKGHSVLESDSLPLWLPANIRSYIATSEGPGHGYDELDKRWKTTTARKLAAWLRSSSGYVHHLKENPQDKLRVGRDDDLAARMFKEACKEGGLDYDEITEMHCTYGILALRRSNEV